MPSLDFPRSARFVFGSLATLVVAGTVIASTWYTVERSTEAQRVDAVARTDALVTGLVGSYADQLNRQTLALDQTLATMARDWEANPRGFNLETERARAIILEGISRDMFLVDENGVIRQSSVPDFIGQSVGDLDVFRDAAEHAAEHAPGHAPDHANDKPTLYIGGASVNPIMRQWHLDTARTLHHPDGSFAGIIDLDYRVSALTDMLSASAPAGDGFAAVIGLSDGKLRATWGATGGTPDASVADTKMFAALDANPTGLWTGPSATDATVRVHAFRRIPGRDLAVIVGVNQREALAPVTIWREQSRRFAAGITALTLALTVFVLGWLGAAHRGAKRAAATRARFAAASALAEVSRARADAVERRLHATFAAVDDGLALFDAHLNLVEWNALFPEYSGVNASFIRTGMPMEEVLRSQAKAGYFGEVEDVEAEVDRRVTLLRAGNFGSSVSFETAERIIELRCRPMAEGGFVALFTDVTEARRARQALRDSQQALRFEQAARSRFLEVISHELGARVGMLRRAIGRLLGTDLPAGALDPLTGVARSLANLAADAVEVPLMEAGAVTPRPALIAVRPLLRDVVETTRTLALDRGITLYQVVSETIPVELIVDPDRMRQILTALLSEALRFATPDTMWLLADGGGDQSADRVALRVTIRGFGPPISEAARARMFPAFGAIAVPGHQDAGDAPMGEPDHGAPDHGAPDHDATDAVDGSQRSAEPTRGPGMRARAPGIPALGQSAGGTGLGPAIARHLATLMGGEVRCEMWSTADGRTGNDFILTLPPELLPGQRGRAPGQAPAAGRPLPRTRILLVGPLTGLRMAAVTMLRRDGHMVDAEATGEAGVRALAQAPYDVAFIDAALPDANVDALLATIRNLSGPVRFTPLIVLTARHEESEERSWRDGGAAEVLAANPTLEEMAGAVERHVWLSRSFGPGLGSIPGSRHEAEDGIPVLAEQRIVELRSNLPREELVDMVEECIADMFHRLPALRRALAAKSIGAITSQSHAMVGMAAGYGMAVLEARLRAILLAVRGRRLDTIDGAADVVEADLTRAAAALRRTLRIPQPDGSRVPPGVRA